ncbi:MAG: glycosyltransferase [Chloroflexota bacterium]
MQAILAVQGTYGDVVPITRVAAILKRCGHTVTLITHAGFRGLAEQEGLDFAPVDTEDEFAQFTADMSWLLKPRGHIAFYKTHTVPLLAREYRLVKENCRTAECVLIGNNLSSAGIQMAAESIGLPLARVFLAPMHAPSFATLEELHTTLLAPELNALRAEFGLPRVENWPAWLRYPQLNLGNWPAWYAAPEPGWPTDLEILPAGFLTLSTLGTGELPGEMQAWLARHPDPILITGSTGTSLKSGFFPACVEACRQLDRPGILLTPHAHLLPSELPDQMICQKFLPLGSIMQHVSVVVHHGGMGSLAQALAAGKPQLILAAGMDRPDNAQRLQRLGVAEYLPPPEWQPEKIAQAIRRLQASPEVRQNCRLAAQKMAAMDPAAIVNPALEGLLAAHLAKPAAAQASVQNTAKGRRTAQLSQQMQQLSAEQRRLLAARLKAKNG